jgi:hypothetical protein
MHSSSVFGRRAAANCRSTTSFFRTNAIRVRPSPRWKEGSVLVVLISFRLPGYLFRERIACRGSTPEPPKIPLPQFQLGDQHIQVNHFIAALEGIMPVQQNVLPGHRRYTGQSLNTFCRYPQLPVAPVVVTGSRSCNRRLRVKGAKKPR